jgi:hypothetical protein
MGGNVCDTKEYYVTHSGDTLQFLPVSGIEAAVAHQDGRVKVMGQ